MQPIILVADDDCDDIYFLSEAIMHNDPSCTCVDFLSGHDMLSFIAQSASMPSLIFLDINMPRLNGKECLQWLKADARFSSIPIIICSTSKNPNDMQECAALGAHYYFTKPMRLKDWEAEVAFILQNFLYVENAKAG